MAASEAASAFPTPKIIKKIYDLPIVVGTFSLGLATASSLTSPLHPYLSPTLASLSSVVGTQLSHLFTLGEERLPEVVTSNFLLARNKVSNFGEYLDSKLCSWLDHLVVKVPALKFPTSVLYNNTRQVLARNLLAKLLHEACDIGLALVQFILGKLDFSRKRRFKLDNPTELEDEDLGEEEVVDSPGAEVEAEAEVTLEVSGQQLREDLPAEDLPAEDLPAEDLPVEDLPVEDLPAEVEEGRTWSIEEFGLKLAEANKRREEEAKIKALEPTEPEKELEDGGESSEAEAEDEEDSEEPVPVTTRPQPSQWTRCFDQFRPVEIPYNVAFYIGQFRVNGRRFMHDETRIVKLYGQ